MYNGNTLLSRCHVVIVTFWIVKTDENNIIQQVFFLGGCNGNLQGISQLVRGQHIDDVLPRLNGIRCGTKGTSCPDQLCRALEQLKDKEAE